MEISAALVKELREKTGAGMMDCKKALAESGADMEKAIELLRKKGLAAAAKKAGRIASEGTIASMVAQDGRSATLVEVNCETDFVARNEEFQAFARSFARQALEQAKSESGTGTELLEQAFVDDTTLTLDAALNARVAKIGEKIDLRRFARYETADTGLVGTYIHLGGKIGVLVEVKTDKDVATDAAAQDLVRDLAMQVAASNPTVVSRHDVPAEQIEAERRILSEQDEIKAKPEAVRPKIVEGRINKYFEQICLLEQAFIKEPGSSVQAMMDARAKTLGVSMQVVRFTKFVLGEGLEKRQDDFAAEVMAQIGR